MRKFQWKRVAIIGVGLIGGSFGQAIRERGLARRIVGIGRSEENLRIARDRGLIDEATTDLTEGVRGADFVFVSVPAQQIVPIVRSIEPSLSPEAMITDAGSVKQWIVAPLLSDLQYPGRFVGGHPIAGTEKSGAAAAFGSLFKDQLCLLTPTKKTERRALQGVEETWRAIGARVELIDPAVHDEIFGLVSHLPHMVAYALMNTVLDSHPQAIQYSGGGLRDFTRVVESPPEMWRDICRMNRDPILRGLERYRDELAKLTDAIRRGEERKLTEFFERAKKARTGA